MRPALRSLVAAAALACGSHALAASPPLSLEDYLAGVRLTRDGRPGEALARWSRLAQADPSSVPVHRAIARAALVGGRAEAWARAFAERLRASPRDIGAGVGLAVIEDARGHRAEATRLALAAVAAGARDPLLVPLIAADRDAAATSAWLAARASLVDDLARFGALRARVLLAFEDVPAARAVLERALAEAPADPDLLTLHADLLRAAGDHEAACAEGERAARALVGERRVPETRVPARLALVRVQAACGHVDEARVLLRTLGPLVTLPGDRPLAPAVALAEAEVRLAAEDPLAALVALQDQGAPPEEDVEWGEAVAAARARARALLGLPAGDVEAVAELPPPGGLRAADRAVRLAAFALALAAAPADPAAVRLAAALEDLAATLSARGLAPRADRLRLLALRVAPPAPAGAGATGPAAARLAPRRGPHRVFSAPRIDPDLLLAAALLDARAAAARGDRGAALAGPSPDDARALGGPAALAAALYVLRARAALDSGEPERAAAEARAGAAALEVADEEAPLPPELEPLVASRSDTGAELAGLALRAALAARRPLPAAADGFLRDLRRVVRSYAIEPSGWPATAAEAARGIPRNACMVFAATGADAPALVVDPAGRPTLAARVDAAAAPPCDGRRAVLWAGPAAPDGGLAPAPQDRRALVRLVRPTPRPGASQRGAKPPAPIPVAAGGRGALREAVEAATGAPERDEGRRLAHFDGGTWPIFLGRGLAPAGSPLSSGWLVPAGAAVPSGWLGPDRLASLDAAPGTGLVALGVRALPGREAIDRGTFMIAEAALAAGWRFALVSRRPLAGEERGRIESRLPEWAADPVREARRLAGTDPTLAEALTLWTAPVARAPRTGLRYAAAALLALVAVAATVVALRRALRGHRPPPPAAPPAPEAQPITSSSEPGAASEPS